MEENEYDLIIVGGGCAGYPAAVYASRFNLKTLVIAKEPGGLITTTHLVENFPGFISLTGQELADKLEAHARANDVPIENDIVKSCDISISDFCIMSPYDKSFVQNLYFVKVIDENGMVQLAVKSYLFP